MHDRIALVTGAAQGIGASIAERLLEDGIKVILTDIKTDELEKTAQHLKMKGAVDLFAMDVGNEKSITDTFELIKYKYNKLDILINNAGISPKVNGKRREVTALSKDEWDEVIRVNLTGAFLTIRAALPMMINQRWGRIVNMSSQAGRKASRVTGIHYTASKTAIIGLTRQIAEDYGKYGITANCVAPGRILTPMVQAVSEEKNQEFINITPVARLGTTNEVAAAVSFLCSEEAGYVTGTTLDVNGGMYMN